MRRLIEMIIHTNIYLALGAASLAYMSSVLLGVSFDYGLFFIAFGSTFFLYNLNRITDIKEDSINYPQRTRFVRKYGRVSLYSSCLIYLLSLWIAFSHGVPTLLITITPAILVVLYSVFRFKRFLILKNLIVATGWALLAPLVYVYNHNLSHTSSLSALAFAFLFIFLRLVVNTIVFDMRDIKGDRSVRIYTIPLVLGVKKTIKVLYLLNTLCLVLLIYAIFVKIIPSVSWFLIGSIIYGYLYIYLINKIPIWILCELADGEFILLGILIFIGKMVFQW